MSQIPFKVSARAARLIGRENVSNAEGAIIELVKNCYDADASVCILFFDNKYSTVPGMLDTQEYDFFRYETHESNIIETSYLFDNRISKYVLKEGIDSHCYKALYDYFHSKACIYIIDDGEGMGKDVLENSWMTIGTNNKESNFKSKNGRIRTGAKGIGRFALDRLGDKCQMITIPENSAIAYRWRVDWSSFEEKDKNIDNVFAELDEKSNFDLNATVKNKLISYSKLGEVLDRNKFYKGTLIKISELRDDWYDTDISRVFRNLESLIPPKENRDYEIFLISSKNTQDYGAVSDSICDDFDYKVYAKLDSNNDVYITIHRNEFDLEMLDPNIFKMPLMGKFPFDLDTFRQGSYSLKFKVDELMPGYERSDFKDIFSELGAFDFSFYFMKRTSTNKDTKMYFLKSVNTVKRMNWLDKFGGVKIYRDNFIVRPYGEIAGVAFDWLALGDRVVKSPAAPSHPSGAWRVGPNQVYGTVNISRIGNVNFEDKSSREGLQENLHFQALKSLIIATINIFERDRQTIYRSAKALNGIYNKSEETVKKGRDIAKKIVAKLEKNEDKEKEETNEHVLAKSLLVVEKEIEELISEMKLLRGLASIGLVISTFTHQLKSISTKLIPRTIQLQELLDKLIPKDRLDNLKNYENPYILLDQFRDDDEKIEKWLNFSLDAIKKDKRRRKKLDLYYIFSDYKRSWVPALNYYSINIHVPQADDKKFLFRVFPIDIDTIFNNLIANSLEAFTKRKEGLERRDIVIDFYEENLFDNKYLYLTYEDSGPGLLESIKDPYQIFEPHFTTKRDSSGNEIGTGLGMWMVKSTIEEYNGLIEVVSARPGFKLLFKIPLRKDEGVV